MLYAAGWKNLIFFLSLFSHLLLTNRPTVFVIIQWRGGGIDQYSHC